MAFSTVTLPTQQLLETTFISDMRLIINANNTVFQQKLESLINTFEIDFVNKYIGVDNYFNQVKVNNVILGNSISFMDSTSVIGSLTKAAGKSILSIDKLVIQAGGSIDMTGSGNTMAVKRLGVGIPLSSITTDGFHVGNSSTPVDSDFYGAVNFASQAVAQSTEGTVNTTIQTVLPAGQTYYHGDLKLSKTSKQFIYVTVKAPTGQTAANTNAIYITVYEDSASRPDPGQTFTIIIKDYQSSTGSPIAVANWGNIFIVPGFDQTGTGSRTPVVINDGALNSSTATIAAHVTDLTSGPLQHIKLFNENVQSDLGSSQVGGTAFRKYAASVSLTKFENGPANAYSRMVVTNSHNIKINH